MKTNWTASDVLCAVRGRSLHAQDWTAQGVSIDSRTITPGELFIAIKGPDMNGHDFVHAAFAKGAVAAIVCEQPAQVPPDATLIFVEDTFEALHDLGRAGRERAKGKIVAVTGSVGKTSTKEQIRLMLGAADATYATQGSLNNHWGVPLCLSRLPQEVGFGVFEIGMNHAGELGPLSKEVRPHLAMITNVEAVHLEHFASTEAIADAKAEIFEGMDPSGIVVLNRDNPHFERLADAARAKGLKRILGFGRHPKSDARLLSVTAGETYTTVEAVLLGDQMTYRLETPGEHLAFNALGSLLCCAALGVDLKTAIDALSAYRPPSGRGTRQTATLPEEQGKITLIDETFNASPIAVKAAIRVLGQATPQKDGRRILVLGDMRELGPQAENLHRDLADVIFENRIDLVHCCGPLMSCLHELLPPAMQGKLRATSEELIEPVCQDALDGDVILIKGSHSMHMEKIVQALLQASSEEQHKTNKKQAC